MANFEVRSPVSDHSIDKATITTGVLFDRYLIPITNQFFVLCTFFSLCVVIASSFCTPNQVFASCVVHIITVAAILLVWFFVIDPNIRAIQNDLATCTIELNSKLEKIEYKLFQFEGTTKNTEEALENFQKQMNTVQKSIQDTVSECRLCFEETEGSSQCQGNRKSCSGWSKNPDWTKPFRDDTDNRGGGCTYIWRIECR